MNWRNSDHETRGHCQGKFAQLMSVRTSQKPLPRDPETVLASEENEEKRQYSVTTALSRLLEACSPQIDKLPSNLVGGNEQCGNPQG